MRNALLLIAALAVVLGGCAEDPMEEDVTENDVCNATEPTMVRLHDQDVLETPSLSLGGLMVTGSSQLFLSNGLGIEGGIGDKLIDGTEWTRFDVEAGAAVDVSYNVPKAGNADHDDLAGEATIEAFDRSGASLGIVPVDGAGIHDVSAAFDGEVISGFVVRAQADTFSIASVTYSACQ
jgi:hypothetical protein